MLRRLTFSTSIQKYNILYISRISASKHPFKITNKKQENHNRCFLFCCKQSLCSRCIPCLAGLRSYSFTEWAMVARSNHVIIINIIICLERPVWFTLLLLIYVIVLYMVFVIGIVLIYFNEHILSIHYSSLKSPSIY